MELRRQAPVICNENEAVSSMEVLTGTIRPIGTDAVETAVREDADDVEADVATVGIWCGIERHQAAVPEIQKQEPEFFLPGMA
jgi:hypothetical protein